MLARPLRALALAAPFALLACGGAPPPAATPTPAVSAQPPPAPPPPDAGAPLAIPSGVPDTAAGHQLAWVLASIARAPTETEAEAHFTSAFLTEVPPKTVVGVFNMLAGQIAPVVLDRIEPESVPGALVAVVRSGKDGAPPGAKFKISLRVDPSDPSRMAGLLVRPVIDTKPAASWDEVRSGLQAVAPQVGFLAANIEGDKCVPVSSIEPTKELALGSTFKLYVLAALAAQIGAGKHTWDEPIAIDDAKKSVQSGGLRDATAGATFTVRELAERMISVSDNTATDHLLAFVGRKAVEDAVKSTGHAAPSRMTPFLSTRELFALKLFSTKEEREAYVRADVAHKRKLLEGYAKRDLSGRPTGEGKPESVASIEWFASPEDLCKVMVALKKYAEVPATAAVGEILAKNPGLPDDAGLYQYIGFKGGSEPGVLNMTFLLERKGAAGEAPAKWGVLTVGFNDPANVIDEGSAVTAVARARDFFGR